MLGNRSIPIMQGHGGMDPLVAIEFAVLTKKALERLGFTNATLRTYSDMAHSSCEEVGFDDTLCLLA